MPNKTEFLKEGTRVQIISKKEYESNPELRHQPYIIEDMFKFCGKTVTIASFHDIFYQENGKRVKSYFINDGCGYKWTEDWFAVVKGKQQKFDIE